MLLKEGSSVSLKQVQKLMKQLSLKSIIVKKYRPQLSNKKNISKENILNQNFSTKNICEKWLVLPIFDYGFTHEENY